MDRLTIRNGEGVAYFKGEKLRLKPYEMDSHQVEEALDPFIASELTESIMTGISYDMLEAHHGILPISRTNFYRRKRVACRIIEQRLGRIEEEKNGQYVMKWG